MIKRSRTAGAIVLSATLLACAPTALAQTASPTPAARTAKPPPCEFVQGFAAMREVLGELIGDCLENERFDGITGETQQRTTRGLLVWRQNTDRLIAFTDGARTWVRAPDGGIHLRPNYQRLPWEAAPDCRAR